jgi:hypothetical protein
VVDAKIDASQEKMEAKIETNNKKCEALLFWMDICQARTEAIQEEIIQDGRPSGKDGSQYECLVRRDNSLPRNDRNMSGEEGTRPSGAGERSSARGDSWGN